MWIKKDHLQYFMKIGLYYYTISSLLVVVSCINYTECVSSTTTSNFHLNKATNDAIWSLDGKIRFVFQTDGNVCLYITKYDPVSVRWSSHKDGAPLSGVTLAVQTDGGLVLYDAVNPIWAAQNTNGNTSPYKLCVANCGYAYLSDNNNNLLWYSEWNVNNGNPPDSTCIYLTSAPTINPTLAPTNDPTPIPTKDPSPTPTLATAIPTTTVPTTAIPTTSIPSTAIPTRAIPTTAMLTTSIPTTDIPTYTKATDTASTATPSSRATTASYVSTAIISTTSTPITTNKRETNNFTIIINIDKTTNNVTVNIIETIILDSLNISDNDIISIETADGSITALISVPLNVAFDSVKIQENIENEIEEKYGSESSISVTVNNNDNRTDNMEKSNIIPIILSIMGALICCLMTLIVCFVMMMIQKAKKKTTIDMEMEMSKVQQKSVEISNVIVDRDNNNNEPMENMNYKITNEGESNLEHMVEGDGIDHKITYHFQSDNDEEVIDNICDTAGNTKGNGDW